MSTDRGSPGAIELDLRQARFHAALLLATPLLCTIHSPRYWLILPVVLACCYLVRREWTVASGSPLNGSALDAYLEVRPWRSAALAMVWATLVAALLLGDNLRAGWGVIDDHAIAHLLGPTGEPTLADVWSRLATHPEVGNPPFDFVRYRPVFWTLRILEAYLWGDHPQLWYGSRLVYFTLSLALFWTLL